MVFPITTVGASYILENAKIRKKQRYFGGIGIYAISDNHTAPETLENLLSRDIVGICFYSHILMKSAVRQGIQDMVRSLSLLPVSATLKTEIYVPASQAADCLEFLAMF